MFAGLAATHLADTRRLVDWRTRALVSWFVHSGQRPADFNASWIDLHSVPNVGRSRFLQYSRRGFRKADLTERKAIEAQIRLTVAGSTSIAEQENAARMQHAPGKPRPSAHLKAPVCPVSVRPSGQRTDESADGACH